MPEVRAQREWSKHDHILQGAEEEEGGCRKEGGAAGIRRSGGLSSGVLRCRASR